MADSASQVASNVLRAYSDLDMTFAIHPIKKDVNKLYGERAIINSMKNLLLTNHYERPFQPYLGSNVKKLLFEPLDDITARILETEIRTVLKNFEPRVDVLQVFVKAEYEKNGFVVNLVFRPLNLVTPVEITFFLERVR